ncbi:hypothetical protein SAY87_007197 [Trapa incisa]|uniref:Uncharacterized protein n=1 Tax=Trapa incisa TaxID=236973 RepID=A0AAN7Q593_9MYRT|nr:hypothetical protein SAY87_007197 [Trapa incisa]
MSTETNESYDRALDEAFARRRCCFWGRSPSSRVPEFYHDEEGQCLVADTCERIGASSDEKPWWVRGWKWLREWSEVVAGPRWKTFIRRISKNRTGKDRKFYYDPMSYAMNFDEGKLPGEDLDADSMWRNFSSRYASIPVSCKSSMDLGKSGRPIFE